MSILIPRCLGVVVLMLTVAYPSWPQSGPEPPEAAQGDGGDPLCGPQLTETQLRDIVRQAIRVTGGNPTNLEDEYRLSIHSSGCDYIVVGVRQPETVAQEFAITIERSGRVKSWPWCCVPQFEIGATQNMDDEVSDRSLVITDAAGRHWPVDGPDLSASCTPAFVELTEPVEVPSGECTISFRLLAVGCAEDLEGAWPPTLDRLEQEFGRELQEPDPQQTLLMIRNRSPELRARLTRRLNDVLNDGRASDVFLFDARCSEQ